MRQKNHKPVRRISIDEQPLQDQNIYNFQMDWNPTKSHFSENSKSTFRVSYGLMQKIRDPKFENFVK